MASSLIRIAGIVQGVGFRPFIHRLAVSHGLKGTVANKGSFVEVRAEGSSESIRTLIADIPRLAPERSLIMKIRSEDMEEEGFSDFSIIESEREDGDIFVSPDIGICKRCQNELFDPGDRRYLHPFINCTACGPRLTILSSMPYDRERTSMRIFPMCSACEEEYTNPETRRFDAQPVCCHDCGPRLTLLDHEGTPVARDQSAIQHVRKALMEGKIVAIKGIGGFHLACDARNRAAIERLRERKRRPSKAFAVMVRDSECAASVCRVSDKARELLTSWQKPIVILERREEKTSTPLPDILAPDGNTLGLMLPYTPLHLLLFSYPDATPMTDALVMTSANAQGAPICHTEELVRKELGGIADAVLTNNRDIRLRCDDTVLDGREAPRMIRRSRGYAPLPCILQRPWKGEVLGIGSELKNTFCLAKNDLFYPSPHVGDLGDVRTCDALKESIRTMASLLEIHPSVIACDTHPRYNSVMIAEELGLPLIRVQHHHAHILSCLAEHDVWTPALGIALDGTGDGQDGTIWGGELLMVQGSRFKRLASVTPFLHVGGDTASREGWRIAVSFLQEAMGEEEARETACRLHLATDTEARIQAMLTKKRFNAVGSTSAGRIFDAVSAILGFARTSSYEGQAAMLLQAAAERARNREHVREEESLRNNTGPVGAPLLLPTTDLLLEMVQKALPAREHGDQNVMEDLAYLFHERLSAMLARAASDLAATEGLQTIALSGGVFQNRLLEDLLSARLREKGFRVLTQSLVPANDGGICLGQAVCAMECIQP
ncbi:MAG: carbamoyltransferase HypF [Desulfovibrio sp.]|nr:carbamoyltransferase HypF [Desulfovibrio sp.]